MTHQEVEAYLHEHIPISKNMEVAVVHATPEEVLLRAPLAPNINHRSTVFGGSISNLAILAGWTLVYLKLQLLPFQPRLVIQSNSIKKARLDIQSQVLFEERIAATFEARYVASQLEPQRG